MCLRFVCLFHMALLWTNKSPSVVDCMTFVRCKGMIEKEEEGKRKKEAKTVSCLLSLVLNAVYQSIERVKTNIIERERERERL